MSKKKATMTLKDFHGGSIPSDLSLPSAPGVMVRPLDRGGYDRQTSWGNTMGRSDHRLRPGSAGTTRNFDDKTPFFSNSTHIGRNFDEDERKPLDGTSGPRRTVSDESLRALPTCVVEPKVDYPATRRVTNRPVSTPGSQYSSSARSNLNSGRSYEENNIGASAQGFVGNTGGQMISGPYPNAWGVRKEAAIVKEPPASASPWSAADAASKLAHASALEKVSSGRWHSKQQISLPRGVEGESHFMDNTYKNPGHSHYMPGGVDYHDASLVNMDDGIHGSKEVNMDDRVHAHREVNMDDRIHGRSKEVNMDDRIHVHSKEVNMDDGIHGRMKKVNMDDGIHVGKPTASVMPCSEPSERRKLKLLPRSKPMENLEPPTDSKQVYHHTSAPAYVDNHTEPKGMKNHVKGAIIVSEGGNPVVERPKLHLNPRKEPILQTEGDGESKRNTLFGGARPRELVLKERGIDNTTGKIDDLVHPIYRSIQDSTKTDCAPEGILIEHRIGKNTDRHDQRLDVERSDSQRRNWRNENRMNKRELDKQQQQLYQQERPPSPETWRRPVENPRPTSSDPPGPRYGKPASAVELAQAFSKSISDSTTADRFPMQRGVPSRGQVPFSRLMGPTPRPQINGY